MTLTPETNQVIKYIRDYYVQHAGMAISLGVFGAIKRHEGSFTQEDMNLLQQTAFTTYKEVNQHTDGHLEKLIDRNSDDYKDIFLLIVKSLTEFIENNNIIIVEIEGEE
jgi:hypothetical protein